MTDGSAGWAQPGTVGRKQVITKQRLQPLPRFMVAKLPRQTLWDTTLRQLDDVASRIGLDPSIHHILRRPEPELTISNPVMMDDGRI